MANQVTAQRSTHNAQRKNFYVVRCALRVKRFLVCYHSIHAHITRLHRDFFHKLFPKTKPDLQNFSGLPKEPVIVSAAPTQPAAAFVKRHARDNNEIHFADRPFFTKNSGLHNIVGAFFQVLGNQANLAQDQVPLWTDPWEINLFIFQHFFQKRLRLDLGRNSVIECHMFRFPKNRALG